MRLNTLLTVATVLAGCTQPEVGEPMAASTVAIELGGPIEAVKGSGVQVHEDRDKTIAIDAPHRVELRFPSGRKWTSDSKTTFISTDDGIVTRINVSPMPHAGAISDAAKALEAALTGTGAMRSAGMSAKMARLRSAPPKWEVFARFSIACDVDDGTHLFVELKPASEANMWFVVCSFYSKAFFECAAGGN